MRYEWIEKEMHIAKEEALRKLSHMLAHPEMMNEFALTLAYAWFDSEPYAEKIAKHLDLDKIDFLAIQGCLDANPSQKIIDAFSEQYLRELEYAQNF